MSKGLTSFRALAFFFIFLFHINAKTHLGISGGYLGVQAFFVLSGFLLTPILLEMKSSLNARDFFIHFYGRRALRIFPLYFSYIVLVASVFLLAIYQYGNAGIMPNKFLNQFNRFIEQLPWTLTYTYDFFHASEYFQISYFATHFWSLAIEEQFYLIWPLAIFFISASHLKKFLLFVIMAGPLFRILLHLIFDAHILPVLRFPDLFIYVLPFSHFDAFAIGGFFALYGKSRSPCLVWASIIAMLMLGMITSWLTTGQIHWDQLGYGPFMKDSYKYIWGYSVVSLMFAYILVHVKNKSFLPVLFENPFLVYLGKISYGLYVFHFPILWLVFSTMDNFPDIVQVSVILLATVLISMASYELMEKRFIKSKDKYFSRTTADKQLDLAVEKL